MIRGAGVLLFVFVAACSVGEAASPAPLTVVLPAEGREFGSGRRLHARYWDVEGTLVFREFLDVARGELCAFQDAGVVHVGAGPSYWCLPIGMAKHDLNVGPYADGNCSRPVALAPLGALEQVESRYVLVRPPNACLSEPEVHLAGKPEKQRVFVRADGGACVQSQVDVLAQPVGEVIPLTSFVKAREQVEERAGRIGALVAVADDGARQVLSAYDRERKEAVRLDETGDAPRWIPSRVAFENAGEVMFEDAACRRSAATKIARDATCPLSAALVFKDQCGKPTVHELGAPVTTLHAKTSEGLCAPAPPANMLAYSLGAEINPSAFANATITESSGDIVHRRGVGFETGVAVWTDIVATIINEPCVPTPSIDGQTHCLPSTSTSIDYYADPTCTRPAVLQPTTGCEKSLPRYYQARTEGEVGARAYEVVGTGTELYQETEAGDCRQIEFAGAELRIVRGVNVRQFPTAKERQD